MVIVFPFIISLQPVGLEPTPDELLVHCSTNRAIAAAPIIHRILSFLESQPALDYLKVFRHSPQMTSG